MTAMRRTRRPGTATTLKRLAGGLLLERRYGLDTSGHVDAAELGYGDGERFRYEPSGWLSLRTALPRRHVSSTDVFADLGSGKGRVIFQAALRYGFKRVIGVELSERLNAVARRNIERNRGRLRCQDVQIVTADALEWEIPDDLSVVYLHNSFVGEIFSRVVHRLVEFAQRRGRPLRLIYVNPVEHERLAASAGVRELPAPGGVVARVLRLRSGAIRLYELGTDVRAPDA